MPENLVAGRTAIVTGAGQGIGRAIAKALASKGARVILVGRRRAPLDALVEESGSRYAGSLVAKPCDVADPESVDALARELGDIDISILINNAGIPGPVSSLVAIDPVQWDETFAINVRGVFLMCRAFLPGMIERRTGDIINIASVTGKRPLAGRTPYAASKMAVIGLTTTLATEVGTSGVMVNSLSPGPVMGDRMEKVFALEAKRRNIPVKEAHDAFVSRAALGRMVTEKEVASAVLGMLHMPGLAGADIDLSAGMIAR